MNWVAYDINGKELGRHFTLTGLYEMMKNDSPHFKDIHRMEKENKDTPKTENKATHTE